MPIYLPLRLLGRYRFVSRLGEGGMGLVLEAVDERLDRRVAIKFMRPGHFHDTAARIRFEREIHTLVLVDHPGVVKVYDSGELSDGTLYLVMERLRGRDVGQLIRSFGPGTPSQVGRLLRQGAGALEAAHGLHVVHRDIKPQHLVLTPEPDGFHTRILDFGLAKSQDSAAPLTRTGALVGTPLYMAPEQILGRDADERTDTFAFASVAYEALVGVPTIRMSSLSEILSAILETPPALPSRVAPWLPPEIDAAFAHALAKRQAERPASVGSWANALAGQLESLDRPGAGWPASALFGDSTMAVDTAQPSTMPTRPSECVASDDRHVG
jgi:serine/threonine protein kinase